jgi:hypothetical protein
MQQSLPAPLYTCNMRHRRIYSHSNTTQELEQATQAAIHLITEVRVTE